MTLVAWILAASTHVPDSAGHLATRPIPIDGANAIAKTCEGVRTVTAGSNISCAAVLLVLAFRESGYNPLASHDHGRGCGAFGVLCTRPHATWEQQVSSAWAIVSESAAKCSEPLALYASGSCSNKAGIAISRARMATAKQLLLDVPFKAPEDS